MASVFDAEQVPCFPVDDSACTNMYLCEDSYENILFVQTREAGWFRLSPGPAEPLWTEPALADGPLESIRK